MTNQSGLAGLMQNITDQILAGERFNNKDFLRLAAEADLYQLGFLAILQP